MKSKEKYSGRMITSSPATGVAIIEQGGKKFSSFYYTLTLAAGKGHILGITETPLTKPDKGREVVEEDDLSILLPTIRQEAIIRAKKGLFLRELQVRRVVTKGDDPSYIITKGGDIISHHVTIGDAYRTYEAM